MHVEGKERERVTERTRALQGPLKGSGEPFVMSQPRDCLRLIRRDTEIKVERERERKKWLKGGREKGGF